MFDERLGGANLGGRSVTMFGDAPIIIKSLDIVCAGQIENNKTSGRRRRLRFLSSPLTFRRSTFRETSNRCPWPFTPALQITGVIDSG